MIAQVLLDSDPPLVDPFSPENPFIIATGLLSGIGFSSMDRISIGGRSPLTRGIKESNAGGNTAAVMSNLDLKSVILSGRSLQGWRTIWIGEDSVRFEDAGEYLGLGVYETAERLLQNSSGNCAMMIIGPAGERQSLAAGVQNLDKDRVPTRICARGGLGALLGSKQIKAIVFEPEARRKPNYANPEKVAALRKAYTQALLDDGFVKTLTTFGTASNTLVDNYLGALPTRNFSSGQFSGAENISGEELFERITNRRGNPSHACMAGCAIRCSNRLPGPDGHTLISPLEFESIAMLGSNLGIDDLDLIAQVNRDLNDLGLDTIEIGAALGVAAEGGVWEFGDKQRLLKLIGEIRDGTRLGCLLANGAYQTGMALGVHRIPVVKRQAMAAYDPRVLKITGITYATSAQGADHTAGMTLRGGSKIQDPVEMLEYSRRLQIENAALDTLGMCLFAGSGLKANPQFLYELMEAAFGIQVEQDFLISLGKKTLLWEWEYNRKVGFKPDDDRIPEWMQKEALRPTDMQFDIPDNVLDQMRWE